MSYCIWNNYFGRNMH